MPAARHPARLSSLRVLAPRFGPGASRDPPIDFWRTARRSGRRLAFGLRRFAPLSLLCVWVTFSSRSDCRLVLMVTILRGGVREGLFQTPLPVLGGLCVPYGPRYERRLVTPGFAVISPRCVSMRPVKQFRLPAPLLWPGSVALVARGALALVLRCPAAFPPSRWLPLLCASRPTAAGCAGAFSTMRQVGSPCASRLLKWHGRDL